jgi:hypothetical protein
VAITLLSVAVLLLAGTIAGVATGKLKLPGIAVGPPVNVGSSGPTSAPPTPPTSPSVSPSASPSASASPTASPSASASPSVHSGPTQIIDDSFPTNDTFWTPSQTPDAGGECTVDGVLTATLTQAATVSYRCHGIGNPFTDVTVKVDSEFSNTDSCAAVWLRYSDALAGGYAVKICQDRIQVVTHSQKTVTLLREFYYQPVSVGVRSTVTITMIGDTMTITRNDMPMGSVTDDTFTQGRVVLGVFAYAADSPAPYQAVFHRVQISTP